MPAKTGAERQREYQARHPEREKAKKARYHAAERIFKERFKEDYRALIDPALPHNQRYRLALQALKDAFPTEWRKTLNDQ